MSKFSTEYLGNFGVPGVNIEPTLSTTYDPYRGLDLTNISYCSYPLRWVVCMYLLGNS